MKFLKLYEGLVRDISISLFMLSVAIAPYVYIIGGWHYSFTYFYATLPWIVSTIIVGYYLIDRFNIEAGYRV